MTAAFILIASAGNAIRMQDDPFFNENYSIILFHLSKENKGDTI